MSADLTIRDLPKEVISALRSRAERDHTSLEEAAVLLLCTAIDSGNEDRAAVDAAWGEEIERRVDAAERGDVELRKGDEVFEEIEAELDKRSTGRDEDAA